MRAPYVLIPMVFADTVDCQGYGPRVGCRSGPYSTLTALWLTALRILDASNF